MTYVYAHPHYSQLADWHDGGGLNGHNLCAEASLGRYLREAAYPFPGSDADLLAQLKLRITGVGESKTEGYTTIDQMTAYLKALRVLGSGPVASDPHVAALPWTINLIRGTELYPAQYPASWFGNVDAPDHYILQMEDGLVNDPLAYWNGQKDCKYTDLSQAIRGGWSFALKAPATLAWEQGAPGHYYAVTKAVVPPAPPTPPLASITLKAGSSVFTAPKTTGTVLAKTAAGEHLTIWPETHDAHASGPWYVVTIGGHTGYALASDKD